jgi:Macrocin-O-methyltransferase (TylF)
MAADSNDLLINGLSSTGAWDFENGWHWFSHPSRMMKFLAHYELYRDITGLPGDVMELGVFKGASLVRWAAFRQALETQDSRRIVGFDAFGKFPTEGLELAADLDFVGNFETEAGDGLSEAEIGSIFRRKGIQNVHTVAGNVFDTVPDYLKRRPATRIALLHLDMDVREPTAFALEQLYERVVPGGLIVIDDYGAVSGASDAVDAFLRQTGLAIEKLPLYAVPAFIRKPG